MSFTTKTKEAILSSKQLDKPSVSFISAVIHTAGSLSYSSDGLGFEISSESKALIIKTVKYIKDIFSIEQKIIVDENSSLNKKNQYIAKYAGGFANEILLACKIIDRTEDFEIIFGIEESIFETEQDEMNYIIGAFLGSGTVSVPEVEGENGYHLEFAFTNGIMADDFASLLLRNGFNPKFANRKDKCLIYFKDIENILNLLTYMKAMKSVIVINEIVAERQTRNLVNRQTNCELANIDKTVKSAEKQIEAIDYIEKSVGLDFLDDKLKEIAVLRRKHPDVSLEELGELLSPPISKSGVNHRLRKLVSIATTIRGQNG
ncbi:MAG: DNA-binding protein WhiA [Clostridia bacterium]